jgi:hypothetical protein
LSALNNIDSSFLSIGCSGFGNNEVLSGRPYGGCAIMWRSDLLATVPVLNTNSRICTIRLANSMYRLLLINVYMPNEDGDAINDLFAEQLVVIEDLISNTADCLALQYSWRRF